jgi:tetratricopeptide (TPR) repeat protein
MRLGLAVVLVLVLAAFPSAGEEPIRMSDWMPFLENGAIDDAERACQAWLTSEIAQTRAEAHKCLANVQLAHGKTSIGMEAVDDDGSGRVAIMREALDTEATKKAADHLDIALKLAPGDLSIHQGRLHMLSSAGLYDRMMGAADESVGMYRTGDALGDVWLAYFVELYERGVYRRAIEYMKVLYKHYPRDHRAAGNISALYMEVGDFKGGLPWAKKAVALAPEDVIDRVNLARIEHMTGDLKAARRDFDVAMKLSADDDRKALVRCWYSDLLIEQKQEKKACALQREAGDGCSTSACSD